MSLKGSKIFEFTYSNKNDSRNFYVCIEVYSGINRYKVLWGDNVNNNTFYDTFDPNGKLKAFKRANQLIKEFTKNKQIIIKNKKL